MSKYEHFTRVQTNLRQALLLVNTVEIDVINDKRMEPEELADMAHLVAKLLKEASESYQFLGEILA